MSTQSRNTQTIISLPKGGGAVGGIGETFSPDLYTGTANLAVPLTLSPGRGGLNPKVNLCYSTGNGNGPFGLGWKLDVPDISRSTDKGLPRYTNDDTFLLTGHDVLALRNDINPMRVSNYLVTSFSPRDERSFSRLEFWQSDPPNAGRKSLSHSFWRLRDQNNVTSIFGATQGAVIADPEQPERIYRWCLELTYDGTGNYVHYVYKPEDGKNIRQNLTNSHSGLQLYLKRIRYGNLVPIDFTNHVTMLDYLHSQWSLSDCFFEVVFDYGEHGNILDQDEVVDTQIYSEKRNWDARLDPFSTYRSCFEIRTYRLCKRVLMFHRIPQTSQPTIVKSTDLHYETLDHNLITQLSSVLQRGYKRSQTSDWKVSEDYKAGKGVGVRSRDYEIASIPPLDLQYSKYKQPNSNQLHQFRGQQNKEPDRNLDDPNYALVDLFGRGVPDILSTSQNGYVYWKNLGLGEFSETLELPVVAQGESGGAPKDVYLGQGGVGFSDITGMGAPDIVVLDGLGNRWGYCKSSVAESLGWNPFEPYLNQPSFTLRDSNLRLIDVTGDGRLDAVRLDFEIDELIVYECQGEKGFVETSQVNSPIPSVRFRDTRVHLVDMTGDGLNDIVLIKDDSIDYWPNLGFGRFGQKVTMDNPIGRVDPKRTFFVDIDGSGPADLVHVESGQIHFWINQSGNSWSQKYSVFGTPPVDSGAISVEVADMFGTGGVGILWSRPGGFQGYQYLPLNGGQKPGLLTCIQNNMGLEKRLEYHPSAELALKAEKEGKEKKWKGRLPFPVHVLTRVEQYDYVSKTRLVTEYDYAHGYYDGVDREFRGFGRVDQVDTEYFYSTPLTSVNLRVDKQFRQPPVRTKTWFHTGELTKSVSREFASEYYGGDPHSPSLEDSIIPSDLSDDHRHQAYRVLGGRILRQEIYGLDGSERSGHPYRVSENRYCVRAISTEPTQSYGVFSCYPMEQISFNYERNPNDPRITHEIVLKVDEFDHILESASIAYPRRTSSNPKPEQRKLSVSYHTTTLWAKTQDQKGYRHGTIISEQNHELTGLNVEEDKLMKGEALRRQFENAAPIAYETEPTHGSIQKRLLSHHYYTYWADDAKTVLPVGEADFLALPHKEYGMALTPGLIELVYGEKLDSMALELSGYIFQNNSWWNPTSYTVFDPQSFFQPVQNIDHFGNVTEIAYDDYALLVVKTKDPLGNTVTAINDYVTLNPIQVQDPNGDWQLVSYDALGTVVGTASVGDSLDGFNPYLDEQTRNDHLRNPLNNPHAILGKATSRVVYDLWQYYRSSRTSTENGHIQPAVIYTIARETHEADLPAGEKTKVQQTFLYIDGFGREVQTKVKTEPHKDAMTDQPVPRWVATGMQVYNNKGDPVRQFEPFFTPTHMFGMEQHGVSTTIFYDPLERVVGTFFPDRTYAKLVFNPWCEEAWDANDTVAYEDPSTDPHVGTFFQLLPKDDYLPTWYVRNINSQEPTERDSAQKAFAHAKTPTTTHYDVLGRPFLTIVRNGVTDDDEYPSHVTLDVQGNELLITDARSNLVMLNAIVKKDEQGKSIRDSDGSPVIVARAYDMMGRNLYSSSMDAGERWTFEDVNGNLVFSWNGRGFRLRQKYDALQRLSHLYVQKDIEPELLTERLIYGEGHPEATQRRLRGRLFQYYDSAGVVTNEYYDFKGNLQISNRRLTVEYRQAVDWSALDTLSDVNLIVNQPNPLLEERSYNFSTTYDALNRAIEIQTPDNSTIHPGYDEGNLLKEVSVRLRDAAQITTFVTQIEYDAKGRRTSISYGNGVQTWYSYDKETSRLTRILTLRNRQFTDDCPDPRMSPCGVQNLNYTYDPVGNVTWIRDDAQQSIFFDNAKITPEQGFSYDPLYRLTRAEGREHIGQSGSNNPSKNSHLKPHYDPDDSTRSDLPHPNDGQAMRRYTEEYEYDSVGNILAMIHHANNGDWTRRYAYQPDNNRLRTTTLPADQQIPIEKQRDRYSYDENGNIVQMPHLHSMQWDYRDQLQATSEQVRSDGGLPETTYYVYDAVGERVRKITERQTSPGKPSSRRKERIYLGGFEIYREYDTNSEAVTLERETLHILDDEGCVALVETRTQGNDGSVQQLIRYQMSNHLGSACLELDHDAEVISYEEYYPYGSTSYQAVRKDTRLNAKRYRYIGKERDEETRLYYVGARYYISWLGRWLNPDPGGLLDGLNLYQYAQDNPINFYDASGFQSESTPKKEPPGEKPLGTTTAQTPDQVRDAARASGICYEGDAIQDEKGDWHVGDWYHCDPKTGERDSTDSHKEKPAASGDEKKGKSDTNPTDSGTNTSDTGKGTKENTNTTGNSGQGNSDGGGTKTGGTGKSDSSNQGTGATGSKSGSDGMLDTIQGTLDVIGLAPVFGEVADFANALISLGRGNYGDALLSFGAMIPGAGMAATAGKWAVRGHDAVKAAGLGADIVAAAAKKSKHGSEFKKMKAAAAKALLNEALASPLKSRVPRHIRGWYINQQRKWGNNSRNWRNPHSSRKTRWGKEGIVSGWHWGHPPYGPGGLRMENADMNTYRGYTFRK
jgi:RHS repeat-associated protein